MTTISMRVRLTVLLAVLLIVPVAAGAQGHMLHGVGPVNSAMGGAGTGLPNESVGALTYNPALLASAEGNQITFSTEFFQDGLQIDVTVGNRTGRTRPTLILGVIPAFGWQMRAPDSKLALGFGLIGIAGFRTDYPEDPQTILFARQPTGFGHIYTDYNLTKIPVAFAYQATPKLAIGASFNVYRGLLAIAPLPFRVFDVSATPGAAACAGLSGDECRFYPLGGNMMPAWAVSGQFGLYYRASDMLSLGASLTTPQNFSKYEWNSAIADPTSPDFGKARTLDFDLDGPFMVGFGVGLKPNPQLDVAIDGHWTKYRGVNGFGGPGGVVDRVVYPFGWRNIWTFKTGVQYQANEKLTLRAGYNHSQTPILKEKVLTGTGAPATFQKHFSGGLGLRMFPFLTAEASFYIVPREHIVGPLLDLDGEVPNGTMDTSNSLKSALIGLNFRF
jgi:long-chain fatty acid transport protein